MKKIVARLLVGVMVAGMLLTGCGKSEKEKALLEMPVERAEDILVKAWGCYNEKDKFEVYGGDSNSITAGFPCEFNLESASELESVYGIPGEAVTLLDNAATLVDEMDSYKFTATACQLTRATDLKNFLSLVQDSVMEKEWGKNAPEKLVIATLDDIYVIVAFGQKSRMKTFEKELKYATDAKIVIERDWK